ncbi:MAG: methylenetetrahydrofolate--tRNA-(uracil(54)-C(5))-methyltransferase (FADH(2)-oxidizing) TrmFO [Myxococcales bacterium]|nr:methylenetetrahydrofolate--tRNA-(uracil(54)-C(5))-methyltransferase (FADH(2)-oxidizing) TrmFO [Myxococcales bacterium]
MTITIVGAGLAGCEAALVLARGGLSVRLLEQNPIQRTPAQVSDAPAELVCSNSLRSNNPLNAVGLIKEELDHLQSPLLALAREHAVPAGDALAVDREGFAHGVRMALKEEPLIEQRAEVVTDWGPGPEPWILATGPLTAEGLAGRIQQEVGERLAFYDAIAPIVEADSLDRNIIYAMSRYGKGDGADYLNIPLTQSEYLAFLEAVLAADRVQAHDFEDLKYFEGCLPLEVMAQRGVETLRYGPMKPVGLPDPRTGRDPYAVIQLRAENQAGTSYNMVGFQTRMKWGDQRRIFQSLPGMGEARFLRLGVVHRNTYVDAPRCLDDRMALKGQPHVHLAGQITGCEGYVESLSVGHLLAQLLLCDGAGTPWICPPETTALGALWGHLRGAHKAPGAAHEPNNIHWGLFPPLEGRWKKAERKARRLDRARQDFQAWLEATGRSIVSGGSQGTLRRIS